MVDLAERAAFDLPLDELQVVPAPAIEDHPEDSVGATGGVNDLLTFVDGAPQRLLDDDVLASSERGKGDRKMEDIGHGDRDRLDDGIGDQVLIVAIDPGNPKRPRELAAPILIESRDGDDLDPRIFGEPLQMELADAAADHADAELTRIPHLVASLSMAGPPAHGTEIVKLLEESLADRDKRDLW
jgi:hypothetical protein